MDALALLTDPLVIVLLAIGVFAGRVFYLARKLKSAARDLTFADLRALEEAKRALNAHKESLGAAKRTLAGNLGSSRDTLRHYKRPYLSSVEGRRKNIEVAMRELDMYDKPLAEAREQQKEAFRRGIKDARKAVREALPRKTHRAPKTI